MPAGFNARHTSMVPSERPPAAGATFPYIGLAVAVLALYAILAVTMPLNPYRAAVALVAFFAMRYCTLGLAAGGRIPMSVAEILTFTVGLTLLITALSALVVSIVGIPITEFAVVIVGLPLAVIAFLLRRPATNPWMAFVDFVRRLFDFSDYTKGEKGVVAALYVAVVGAVVFLVSLANVHYPDAPSVGLALTGPDGTANSLNRSFVLGQPKSITVTVMGNDTASLYELRIRLVPLNATGTEPFHTVSTTSPLRMDAFGEFFEPIRSEESRVGMTGGV